MPPTSALGYLARLFSCFDQDICACWNGQCQRSTCEVTTQSRALYVLDRLDGTPKEVFGDTWLTAANVTETQRADLLVTWQWLRNRMWRLASLHGLVSDDGPQLLSSTLPWNVAVDTLEICRQLPLAAMEAHGTGFIEKLYDVISIALDVSQDRSVAVLTELFGFVAAYRRGGSKFVAPLADRLRRFSSQTL